jgi:hypothetical protein
LREHLLDLVDGDLRVEGLEQRAIGSRIARATFVQRRVLAVQHEHRHATQRGIAFELANHVVAGFVSQADVHDCGRWSSIAGSRKERVAPVVRHNRHVLAGEREFEDLPHRGAVIHHEQRFGHDEASLSARCAQYRHSALYESAKKSVKKRQHFCRLFGPRDPAAF